jgi:hypothetical protein
VRFSSYASYILSATLLGAMAVAPAVADNTAGQTNALAEYTLHNLSDADFTYSGPAVDIDNVILAVLAPEFGYSTSDANYFIKFRNPVFSFFTAERLLILYSEKGIDGVRSEVKKLRDAGIV